MQGIKTIIWDWNGTLLNDMDICVDSINVLLKKRALPLMDLEKYRKLFTFPVIRYYEMIGFDFVKEPYDDVAMEFIHDYLARLQAASLFHDVLPALNHFKDRGIDQAILSAMENENLEISVKSKGIDSFFSVIMGTDDHYAHGKTYLADKIIHKLRVSPEQTLIVGDTLHDHEVAETLGCQCVLVAAGHQSHDRLEESGCTVVDSLEALPELFNGI